MSTLHRKCWTSRAPSLHGCMMQQDLVWRRNAGKAVFIVSVQQRSCPPFGCSEGCIYMKQRYISCCCLNHPFHSLILSVHTHAYAHRFHPRTYASSLGNCRTGEVKITKGYNLPARYGKVVLFFLLLFPLFPSLFPLFLSFALSSSARCLSFLNVHFAGCQLAKCIK